MIVAPEIGAHSATLYRLIAATYGAVLATNNGLIRISLRNTLAPIVGADTTHNNELIPAPTNMCDCGFFYLFIFQHFGFVLKFIVEVALILYFFVCLSCFC